MKRDREIQAIDMANCLMLLAKVGQNDDTPFKNRVFACKTCGKRFSSFQALGGHRASHKKLRLIGGDAPPVIPDSPKKPKSHECSICGLEFALGQALGGHMRRHRAVMSEGSTMTRELLPEMKKSSGYYDEDGLCLDLNLAPCGSDLELKLGKVAPTPVVQLHCFI